MSSSLQKCILDIPDEILEGNLLILLSFNDLLKLKNLGNTRLANCSNNVIKKKPLNIAVIGGWYQYNPYDDVEVISFHKDSIHHTDKTLPSLYIGSYNIQGAQLTNGDLLVAHGGWKDCICNDEYLLYKEDSASWIKIGKMMKRRSRHSSVIVGNKVYSCGGYDSTSDVVSYHEEFSYSLMGDLDQGVTEKKELPIALRAHTATVLDESRFIVCGGDDRKNGQYQISRRTFIYDTKANDWTEGPSLIIGRERHFACAIPSDNGKTKCIIVLGGYTNKEQYSKSTEILTIKDRKWIPGPDLPRGMRDAACVALPPTMKYALLMIGGSDKYEYLSTVYGLNVELTKWTLLGNIRKRRSGHIALPLS